MSTKSTSVLVNIMGKEYRIACAPEEQDNLVQSATDLDLEMRKMRDSGKFGNAERIAVMAALNMSHELQNFKNQGPLTGQGWKECLTGMVGKIENVLEKR